MIFHRHLIVLATCITCLGWIWGANRDLRLEPAHAWTSVHLSSFTLSQSSPQSTEQPSLRLGSQGTEVKELQEKLKQLGYYNGTIDGTYGESTEQAISQFQEAVGLTVDGIAGATTWNRLEADLAQTSDLEDAVPTPPNRDVPSLPGWLIGAVVTMVAMSSGFFLVQRFGNKGKAKPANTQPDNKNVVPNDTTQTLELESPANGNTEADEVTVSLPTPPKQPFQATTLEDTLPLEQTTRLAKTNRMDELIQDLHRSDLKRRRKAIWELAQHGDSRAIQPLVELMIDSDSQQRGLILEALSQISTRTLQPMNRALAVSLQDDNVQVRINAIRDLTRVYESVAQVSQILCSAADDPNPEVKETALWAINQLSRIRTAATLESLPPSLSYPFLQDATRTVPPVNKTLQDGDTAHTTPPTLDLSDNQFDETTQELDN